MMAQCFACGKLLKRQRLAACLDEQTVEVGPDCFKKIAAAGRDGFQPPRGGPRLFTLEAKAAIVSCDCQLPETTHDGFAAVSCECPIHGEWWPRP